MAFVGSGLFYRKAEEYLRLSQVKCTGLLAQMTATSNAVMCLDLAASYMQHPIADKVGYNMDMVFSFVLPKPYQLQ